MYIGYNCQSRDYITVSPDEIFKVQNFAISGMQSDLDQRAAYLELNGLSLWCSIFPGDEN